jgi:hypothetical protein
MWGWNEEFICSEDIKKIIKFGKKLISKQILYWYWNRDNEIIGSSQYSEII